MKEILFRILLFIPMISFGQYHHVDSMRKVNDSLDSRIFSIINEYEEKGYDYIILRVFDSLVPITSRCKVMYREDSCTNIYSLDVHINYEVSYAHIGRIFQRNHNECYDEIGEIRKDLTFTKNYFSSTNSIPISFRDMRYTLYGKIDDEYIYETFEENFVNKHHPGMLHYVIYSKFGVCSY